MLPDRIESKFIPEPNSGCWLWTASLNEHGYGRLRYEGRSQRAHRVIFRLIRGSVPPLLDHKCRTRCCVNPDHLEAVTNAENVRRGAAGLINSHRQRSKATCPQGHPYAGDNLIILRNGERLCRACTNEKHRRYRINRIAH